MGASSRIENAQKVAANAVFLHMDCRTNPAGESSGE